MITKNLILKLFNSAYMQRWNDKLRPIDFIELDKQAHKMITAYFLGKFEENNIDFNWIEVIEGGIFELLQRLVITDLKPPVFYMIKSDKSKYKELNIWVYKKLEPILLPLGVNFCNKFKEYFLIDNDTINKRIVSASHFYASKWEFDILERANPNGYELSRIKEQFAKIQDSYKDLEGIIQLSNNKNYRNFLDLCGQLRFQTRWSNIYRIPKTSVLGHMLYVAILSYLFSLQINACKKRCINNYFTGLFHDLPEVLTRDIISPVKRSTEGIESLIKEYEKLQMATEVYSLIPEDWHKDIRMFTENEFDSIVTVKGESIKINSGEINKTYNDDTFNPRDGELVKAVDILSAFIEASEAINNGSGNKSLVEAKQFDINLYGKSIIADIDFGKIYEEFE